MILELPRREAMMSEPKPYTAVLVVGGNAVLVSMTAASGALRLTDVSGVCLLETRWNDSWDALMAAANEVAHQGPGDDMGALVNALLARSGGAR